MYVGGYERDSYTDGRIEHRYSVAPGVMLIKSSVATRAGTYYTHQDRLGSTSTVTKADGSIISQNGFDAFGMPRSGDWAMPLWGWTMSDTRSGSGYTNPGITRRGFTDHEQLDQLGLTHMNGRMYDYRLGRFLGVDPIIQFPTNSQSLNPYSYIMNNPLSGTDPTGYAQCKAGETCNEERPQQIQDPKENVLRKGMSSYYGPTTSYGANGSQQAQDSGDGRNQPKRGAANIGDPKHSPTQMPRIDVKPTQQDIYNYGDDEMILQERNRLNVDIFGGISKIVGAGFVCTFAPEGCMAYGLADGTEKMAAGDQTGALVSFGSVATAGMLTKVPLPSVPISLARPLNVTSLEKANAISLVRVNTARDSLAAELAPLRGKAPATVTAGYNTETGEIAARACAGGRCAENHVSSALGGTSNVRFTQAIRPRTGEEVPVCARCESTFGRSSFPSNARFRTDETPQ